MNRKQFLLTLLLAIISAFLGGTLGVWFLMPPSVLAQEGVPKVIEAQEFRVVDEDGNVRAQIEIGQSRLIEGIEDVRDFVQGLGGNLQTDVRFSLLDGRGNAGAILRVGDNGDAVFRVGAELVPSINMMSDARRGASLWLLNDEGQSITIPSNTSNAKHSADKFVLGDDKAILRLDDAGNPAFELYDSEGRLRAVLGTTQLENPDTGFAEIGAPSSLILLDEDGKVVWWAP